MRRTGQARSEPERSWTGAHLSGDDFPSSILNHANLPGAKLDGTFVTNANMLHAVLLGADRTGAIMPDLDASPSVVRGY